MVHSSGCQRLQLHPTAGSGVIYVLAFRSEPSSVWHGLDGLAHGPLAELDFLPCTICPDQVSRGA